MLLEQIKNIPSTRSDLRKFGLTVGIALLILGGVLWSFDKSAYRYIGSIGGALIVIGLALPIVLKPLQKVWMAMALTMGWFMTRLILALTFYLVFTPLSLVMRAFGKQFLDLRWDPHASSYWNRRPAKEYRPEDSEKQF